MSGGVDSSVVAGMLAAEGYDVIGVTLQLYDHGEAVHRSGACCAGRDIHDARRVAEEIGIPHYVLDYEDRFRRAVIERFAESYISGDRFSVARFYAEIEGHPADAGVAQAFEELDYFSKNVRVLGVFPAAEYRNH